jgi:maleate cis-trans isomerase
VDQAWEDVTRVAAGVAEYHVDCIFIGGGPLAYMKGPGAHRDLAAMVTDAVGLPVLTEMGSTVNALRHVGARRIALASPFGPPINEPLQGFLESEGFEIVATDGLGYRTNAEVTILPLHASRDSARRVADGASTADAVYITCPRWPVSPNVEELERELGLPVVASVPALMWSVLRQVGIDDPVPGYGRLLAGT